MGLLMIVCDVAMSNQDLVDNLKLGKLDPRFSLMRIGQLIDGLNEKKGVKSTVNIGGTQPTSTITFTGQPVATETCSINGVTFTARASGAVANEFNIGPTFNETAANLAAAVNASTSAAIQGQIRATVSGGVVTLTAVVPRSGTQGLATTTETLTNATTSGAFAGGADVANTYKIDVGRS